VVRQQGSSQFRRRQAIRAVVGVSGKTAARSPEAKLLEVALHAPDTASRADRLSRRAQKVVWRLAAAAAGGLRSTCSRCADLS